MEVTQDEENNAHESPHITHEFLVTTLATLCTSQENVEHIVPCLVDNLTTMCGSMLVNTCVILIPVKDC